MSGVQMSDSPPSLGRTFISIVFKSDTFRDLARELEGSILYSLETGG